MNREQRTKQKKEERRNPNSKNNFKNCGYKKIPINKLVHDSNLKECDIEVVDLMLKLFSWAEKGSVKNNLSNGIISKGCSYLDALCSVRFDITPNEDKALVRDTMYYVGNVTNLFIGMMIDEKYEDRELREYYEEALTNGRKIVPLLVVQEFYPQCNLPDKELFDDLYASFIGEHAKELTSFLQHTRKSDIDGDEEYVLEVLQMILKKTNELLQEV